MTSDMQNSPQDPTPTPGPAAGGLPMRGFAMILIAVAVLLGAWALWSMTSKDDSSTVATTETQSPTTVAGTAVSQAPAQSSVAAAPISSAPVAAGANTSAPATAAAGAPATAAAGAPAAGATGAAGSANAAGTPVTTLHVLNNSTVPQLAARVADELKGDYEHVESGNLSDVVVPENTVYFTPGNTAAEEAARELADRVGGIAVARTDVLPKETEGNDAIVLVLTQDVAL